FRVVVIVPLVAPAAYRARKRIVCADAEFGSATGAMCSSISPSSANSAYCASVLAASLAYTPDPAPGVGTPTTPSTSSSATGRDVCTSDAGARTTVNVTALPDGFAATRVSPP